MNTAVLAPGAVLARSSTVVASDLDTTLRASDAVAMANKIGHPFKRGSDGNVERAGRYGLMKARVIPGGHNVMDGIEILGTGEVTGR